MLVCAQELANETDLREETARHARVMAEIERDKQVEEIALRSNLDQLREVNLLREEYALLASELEVNDAQIANELESLEFRKATTRIRLTIQEVRLANLESSVALLEDVDEIEASTNKIVALQRATTRASAQLQELEQAEAELQARLTRNQSLLAELSSMIDAVEAQVSQ